MVTSGPANSDSFNPYEQWLGISCEDVFPDHYELLGLNQFVHDAAAIESAADRQMSRIRVHQTGPRGHLTQQILNKIAEAKLCLLDKESRKKYDAELMRTLADRKVSRLLPPRYLPSVEAESTTGATPMPAAPPGVQTTANAATPDATAVTRQIGAVPAPPPVQSSMESVVKSQYSVATQTRYAHRRKARFPWGLVVLLAFLLVIAGGAVLVVWWLNAR